MIYWLDTEFIEDGRTIDLLSIGIVAADGREYYAESLDCERERANSWVCENVIPHLEGVIHFGADNCRWGSSPVLRPREVIAREIALFCDPSRYGKPEFWGYYADYDWVALCQLFGTMTELPKGWPMYCRDIKQRCDDLGNPALPEQGKDEHHALADARWNRRAWGFLHDLALHGPQKGGVRCDVGAGVGAAIERRTANLATAEHEIEHRRRGWHVEQVSVQPLTAPR